MAMKAREFQQRSWGWRVREAKASDHMLKEDRDLLATRLEERRQAWEKGRRHGIAFYVFTRWTLKFGCIWTGWFLFLDFYLHPQRLQGTEFLVPAVVTFIAATLMGIWDWQVNEKRYRKK